MNVDINRVNVEDSDDDGCSLGEEPEEETPDPDVIFADERVASPAEPELVFQTEVDPDKYEKYRSRDGKTMMSTGPGHSNANASTRMNGTSHMGSVTNHPASSHHHPMSQVDSVEATEIN